MITRILAIYSAILTTILALSGFAPARTAAFKSITVQRLNIIEPDGTLRMVIADKALFPGIIIKGVEHPHPNRHTAGMLFFNDEGTENGGLTFGGSKDAKGEMSSSGHLSFDEYEQDQVITIGATQQGIHRRAAFTLVDDPDFSIAELIAVTDRVKDRSEEEKRNEIAKFMSTHGQPHQRVYIGKADDHSVALRLKDPQGRDRIVIEVQRDGSPSLRFLDESGKQTAHLP
jgi:hypothetical protein